MHQNTLKYEKEINEIKEKMYSRNKEQKEIDDTIGVYNNELKEFSHFGKKEVERMKLNEITLNKYKDIEFDDYSDEKEKKDEELRNLEIEEKIRKLEEIEKLEELKNEKKDDL
jgi:hypothetical protein